MSARTAVRPFSDCSSSAPSAAGGVTPMRLRESKPSKTLLLVPGKPGMKPGATATAADADRTLLASDEARVLGPVAALDLTSRPDPDPAALLPALMRVIGAGTEAAALRGSSPDPSSPAEEQRVRGQRPEAQGHGSTPRRETRAWRGCDQG